MATAPFRPDPRVVSRMSGHLGSGRLARRTRVYAGQVKVPSAVENLKE